MLVRTCKDDCGCHCHTISIGGQAFGLVLFGKKSYCHGCAKEDELAESKAILKKRMEDRKTKRLVRA